MSKEIEQKADEVVELHLNICKKTCFVVDLNRGIHHAIEHVKGQIEVLNDNILKQDEKKAILKELEGRL